MDDDLIVCPPITPGWWYNEKSNIMTYSKNLAEVDTDKPDVRTAKVLNQIANKLEPDIQMTFDVPSLHDDNMMPVLDLKVWVKNNRVLYTFIRKMCHLSTLS